MRRSLLAAAVLIATFVAAKADDEARTIVYRLDEAGDPKRAAAISRRLTERWREAGYFAVTADPSTAGDRVLVRLPPSDAAHEDVIRRLAERRGRIEFRARADEKVEQDWASRVERYAAKPDGFEWLPKDSTQRDPRKVLVESAAADAEFVNDALVSVSLGSVGFT